MSVSLAEVALAARARQAPLAAESAGYLVLAVADQVALAARAVRPDAIELNDDGSVRLLVGEPVTEGQAEGQLRALLADLLKAASSLTPALARLTSRPPLASVAAFVAELEAALIPVNRAAARRALARLSRETTRAVQRGLPPALPEPPVPAPPPEFQVMPAVEVVAPVAVAVAPAPTPAPAPVEVEVEIDVEVEPTPEPLAETRPEPVLRRASAAPPEPLGRTPRLGTMMAPSVRVEAPDHGDVTDPMPSVEAVEEILDERDVAKAEPPAALDSQPAEQGAPEPEPLPVEARTPRSREPKRSELGSLLKAFASEEATSEPDLRRELKKIAGLDLTPPPVPASDP